MSMFPTKILLAVDGSEEAERAAFMGVELSYKTNSELHVVYVASFPRIVYVSEDQEEMRGKLTEREGYRLAYAGAPFPGMLQVPKQEHRRELALPGLLASCRGHPKSSRAYLQTSYRRV